MSYSTAAQILTDLAGITYSSNDHTVVRKFRIEPDEFVDFTNFPAVFVTDGDDDSQNHAVRESEIMFHPELHFFAEAESASDMATWRDDIRDALMSNTTLWGHADDVEINGVTAVQSPEKSLQKLIFSLTITFRMDHST